MLLFLNIDHIYYEPNYCIVVECEISLSIVPGSVRCLTNPIDLLHYWRKYQLIQISHAITHIHSHLSYISLYTPSHIHSHLSYVSLGLSHIHSHLSYVSLGLSHTHSHLCYRALAHIHSTFATLLLLTFTLHLLPCSCSHSPTFATLLLLTFTLHSMLACSLFPMHSLLTSSYALYILLACSLSYSLNSHSFSIAPTIVHFPP